MATIRRKKHTERHGRITDAALAAFRAGDRRTLHAELRLPPWAASPLDAEGACPWPHGTAGASAWPLSCELREALDSLA